jgi:hypothetical protein
LQFFHSFELLKQLFASSHHDFLLLLKLDFDFKLSMLHKDYQLIFIVALFFSFDLKNPAPFA